MREFHHAHLLVGEPTRSYEKFLEYLEKLDFSIENNPDYFSLTTGVFGIDEAREVSRKSAMKAFGYRKVFFLSPERFTSESQNALLKLLEEPSENTHFFIVVREKELIIPTLLSRLTSEEVVGGQKKSEASKFIEMSPKDRLQFAKDFSEAGGSLSGFVDGVLLEMKKRGESLEKLRKVFNVRKFADDRAAMPRLILEHIALLI